MTRKLMTLALLSLFALGAAAGTYYVTPGGTGDGSDWDHAADLATAAANADATELKLLAGDYPLTAQLSFASGRNVRIVGGYTGDGETRGSEKSVLCRDTSVADMRILSVTDATAAFSDVVIRGGRFSGSYGHGVNATSSALSFTRCAFEENVATGSGSHYGGALAANGGSAKFTDCTFTANRIPVNSTELGGAIWTQDAMLELSGCLFLTNYVHSQHFTPQGGAIYASGGSALVTNCVFNGNYVMHNRGYQSSSGRKAAGGAIVFNGVPSAKIVDSVFDGNYAYDNLDGIKGWAGGTIYLAGAAGRTEILRCVVRRGGVSGQKTYTDMDNGSICLLAGEATVANTLVVGAHASAFEAADGTLALVNITAAGGDDVPVMQKGGTVRMVNSILWDNVLTGGSSIDFTGGTLSVTYSDVQGGCEGTGNFAEDPLFADDLYRHLQSRAGYYIGGCFSGGSWTVSSATSPAIDKGDPSAAVGAETQPNGHRANIGAYAGTEVASRSKLGSDPIVRDDELKVFAYDVTALLASGEIRGEVASTGGGADPTVYAVWDTTDHGASSALGDWTHSVEIGSCARWELFTKVMSPVSGTVYCRLLATNDKGTVLSDPAIELTPAEMPILSDAQATRISRKFLMTKVTLSSDGNAATTLRCRFWASATPESVTTNWYNGGFSVAKGTECAFDFTGLTAETDYRVEFDAINGAGIATDGISVTTLSETEPIVRYVTPEGAGAQTGVDWANAFSHLQDALDECYAAGDIVYVKEGDYEHYGYEDSHNPSAAAIASAAGLTIRGGYAGSGAPGEKGTGRTVFRQPNESTWELGSRRHIRILDSTVRFVGVDFAGGQLPNGSSSTEDHYGDSVSAKNSTLSFEDCAFSDNGLTGYTDNNNHYGGAIALRTGTLAITNSLFNGNRVRTGNDSVWGGSHYGGAIYANNAATTISGTTFDSNGIKIRYWTLKGGAICCDGTQGSLAVDHCTFMTNWCQSEENYNAGRMKGGSITVENLKSFDLSDSTFLGGWANCKASTYAPYTTTGQGGAIDIINTPSTITRTSFYHMGYRDTTHDWDSGAVTLTSGSLALKNVLFADTWGHALDMIGGTLAADSCSFVGATLFGFYQRAGAASFRNCLFNGCGEGDFFYYGGTQATFDYCFTQTAKDGAGNSTADPLLVDGVYCHPASRAGRYDGGWFAGGEWVTTDAATSPAIDAGDPDETVGAEAEAKPNGHRLNVGYDAGLDVASKSDLGENPVVDPDVLNVFAYEATGVTKTSATMRGEVASVANAGKATVTVYWGASDPGKTASGWDHSEVLGEFDAWQQFSHVISEVKGTVYYRFKIANDAGEAWTGPSQSFDVTEPPTGTLDGVTHVTRHTAKVHGTLTSTGGADTTVKLVVSRGSEETEYPVNNGNPVAEGTSFAVDVAGLMTNTTYDLGFELTNKGGTTTVSGTLTTLTTNAIVRYVTPTGAGIADGLTWASAYSNMQEAVEACVYAGDVIYLKGGTYRECGYYDSDDYSQCFISNAQDLVIRGGYAGDGAPGAKGAEPTVFIRDTAALPHPYRRLFRCKDSKLLFEGISFTNGCVEVSPGYGHGIQLENCRATLRDCRILKCGFSGGWGECRGGAIYAQKGSLRLENCMLAENVITRWSDSSACYGGGIYATDVSLSLTNCVLAHNSAQNCYQSTYGGGIYASGGSLLVEDSRFCTNTVVKEYHSGSSDGRGGNLYVSGTPTVIRGCDFVGGYAAASFSKGGNITFDLGGKAATMDRCRMYGMAKGTDRADIQTGSLRLESGTLALTNCLVASIGRGNAIDVAGGTLSMDCCTVADAAECGLAIAANVTPTMRNTIVWGNATGGIGGTYASNLAATYCDIQGVTPDPENHVISIDPKFRGEVKGKGQQWNVSSSAAATIGAATFLSLQSSAYELRSSSPCVNAGDATGVAADATDLSGGPRVRSGGLDLGCYEAICRGLLLLVK